MVRRFERLRRIERLRGAPRAFRRKDALTQLPTGVVATVGALFMSGGELLFVLVFERNSDKITRGGDHGLRR